MTNPAMAVSATTGNVSLQRKSSVKTPVSGFSAWGTPPKNSLNDTVCFSGRRQESRLLTSLQSGLHGALLTFLLGGLAMFRGPGLNAEKALLPLPEASAAVVQVAKTNPEGFAQQQAVYNQLQAEHAKLSAQWQRGQDIPFSHMSQLSAADQKVTQAFLKEVAHDLRCTLSPNADNGIAHFNTWVDTVLAPKTDAATVQTIKTYAQEQYAAPQQAMNSRANLRLIAAASMGLIFGVGSYVALSPQKPKKKAETGSGDAPPTEPPADPAKTT